jgi:hypothetical protein
MRTEALRLNRAIRNAGVPGVPRVRKLDTIEVGAFVEKERVRKMGMSERIW